MSDSQPPKPIVAQKAPYPVDIVAGQTYYWCACGRSQKQPFCDGAHKAVGLNPMPYKAVETKQAYLCGCKATASAPFCDGTHKRLA